MEPSETRCIISRDVTFDESRMTMLSKEQKDNNLSSENTNFEVEHSEKLEIMKSWLLSMTCPIINWLEIEKKG